jgi:hypothetical protein
MELAVASVGFRTTGAPLDGDDDASSAKMGGKAMETYRFYPPRLRSTQVPYHEIVPGSADCQHRLAEEAWLDRISVRDALVCVTYTCEH